MASTYKVHIFHLIWSTKHRKNLILPKMKKELYGYMGGIIRKSDEQILEIGGIENHVHLLVKISNLDKYTSLIRNTKASSSAWIKTKFNEARTFGWQDGYASFTVNVSQIEKTRKCIQNQESRS